MRLFFLALTLLSFNAPANSINDSVFWKNKPELLNRLEDERAILVSAHVGENSDFKEGIPEETRHSLRVSGVGLVNAPLAFSIKEVTKYDNLPNVDDRFVEAKFNKKKSELFVHCTSYGIHISMTLLLKTESHPGSFRINWETIDGNLKGMRGWFELRDHQRQKSEFSMTARYTSAKLPLPEILTGFALEVIAQRVAGSMRSYLEGRFKDEQKFALSH